MQFLAVRCAIVSILLVAAGCAASDETQSVAEVPVSKVAAIGTDPETPGPEPTSTEPAAVLVIGGDDSDAPSGPSTSSSSVPASTDASSTTATADATPGSTTTSTSAGDRTSTSSSTAGSSAPGSTSTSVAPNRTTSTVETTTTTEPIATTEAPINRPGAFINVNFQSTPTGTYDDARIRADWGGGAVRYTKTDGRAVITDEGGNRFVRIRFPQGKVGPSEAGSQWAVNLGSNASDELFISYRVRFVGSNFDFVRGGKLPGLSGGDSNTGGRKPNGDDGWSSRIMWRPQGAAVQYVYHPDQPTIYGDDMSWGQTFPTDRWVRVETRIKMNTPGQRNGVVQSWMDGRRVLDRTDIRFRDTSGFEIDRFLFDTFFGGNSPEWAPSKEEYIDFDDFVVSGSPINN